MSIRCFGASVFLLVLLAFCYPCAEAGVFQDGDTIMVQGTPDTIHFNPSPEHTKYAWLVGVEWQSPSRWLLGASYFNNSFGQKSQYLYGGKYWPIASTNLYFKLTGGVILGYKEPYEDKIPFNHNGIAPGIIPGLGYKKGDFNVQLNLLGTAGLMITVGYDLLK